MSIRHNCGKEKDLELSWVDPTGNTADRIKCNVCGREFVDTIFVKRLKELCKKEHEDWVNGWGADLITNELIEKAFHGESVEKTSSKEKRRKGK